MDDISDEYIYKFCYNNDDIRCKCLNPDSSIIKIGEETRLPYYCWYEPCKLANALLVKSLKKNIERCNVSECVVSLGNVNVSNGNVNVKNICGGITSFNNDIFFIRYLNQDIVSTIFNPFWFPIALMFITCLLFIIC
ncbi:MV entry-fusion complex protein [Brazilian porcupinepox virus 1]|nr:MV entry-fusion complex protein [Brazilian porcupinepox virus 1]